MDTKVLIKSSDTLDLSRDFGRVLQVLIDDGWIVLKDATDTDSIQRVMNNHVRTSALYLSSMQLKVPSALITFLPK